MCSSILISLYELRFLKYLLLIINCVLYLLFRWILSVIRWGHQNKAEVFFRLCVCVCLMSDKCVHVACWGCSVGKPLLLDQWDDDVSDSPNFSTRTSLSKMWLFFFLSNKSSLKSIIYALELPVTVCASYVFRLTFYSWSSPEAWSTFLTHLFFFQVCNFPIISSEVSWKEVFNLVPNVGENRNSPKRSAQYKQI